MFVIEMLPKIRKQGVEERTSKLACGRLRDINYHSINGWKGKMGVSQNVEYDEAINAPTDAEKIDTLTLNL